MRKALLITCSLLVLAACDLSPDYTLPQIAMPAMFKEAPDAPPQGPIAPVTDGSWKRTDDKAKIEEFAWWRMFNDAQLNAILEQAMQENPSLEVAQMRVEKARALAGSVAADQYPQISAGFGPVRQQASPASINAAANNAFNVPRTIPFTLYTAQGTISYDLDVFGRNRNRTEAAQRDTRAEEANYRAARLLLQADVAQAYFAFTALQAEEEILLKTTRYRDDTLKLTRQKRDVGEVDDLQISAAETELANVQAELAAVKQTRALEEHRLAVLVGQAPAQFVTPKAALSNNPPAIPAGLPSSLLERRPDVQQAVEQIAAANARIGVARTGYFPDISLTAQGGFTAETLKDLFKWSNRTWLLGPMVGTVLTQPIFEGGRLSAAIAESKADYQGAVATYRGAVLQAFREVEDQLSNVRNSAAQKTANVAALKAAQRTASIAKARFDAGYSSQLEYLDAERGLLAAERANVQTHGQQFIATAQLVKALGGSWEMPEVKVAPEQSKVPAAAASVEVITEPAAAESAIDMLQTMESWFE